LGILFLDKKKHALQNMPASLVDLEYIDSSNLDKRIFNTKLIVLCDVDNPLLGKDGAAAIFGPQKGAGDSDIKKLEEVKSWIEQFQKDHSKNIFIPKK